MGIGDRGRTAAAITGRTRIGPGGNRPHHQALAIKRHHRTTACCNGVNGQHRGLDPQAQNLGIRPSLPSGALGRALRIEDIGGCAAHVHPHHRAIGLPHGRHGIPGRGDCTHHAARRARENRVLRMEHPRGCQGPAGAHHPQALIQTQAVFQAQGLANLVQIAKQHRSHGGLHQGGLAPGYQARLAAQLTGEHHLLQA